MAITVRDLFQYDPNFDHAKIRRLTGKSNYKKTDNVDLSRLAALNDKGLSVFVAKKEGKSFINSIQNDNMKTQVADAAGIKDKTKNQNNEKGNVAANIPMDKSVFDIKKPEIG
ncbi:unknown [Clostridium sp. CAG:729]|nr:unknown [Clostridium sp. CAG:729]